MPYTVNWYIKDEIIYVRYSGAVTADELHQSLIAANKLIDVSPRDFVHAINDVGDVTEPVSIKDSMRIVREVGNHPRTGWTLTIRTQSNLLKMGSGLGASIFKLRYRAFDTLDQALHHLKQFDQRISWDKVELTTSELLET